MGDPTPTGVVARIAWWSWRGGLFGAVFIALAILPVPKVGAATFIALLVAGQMLASATSDHFGWLGLAQREIDLPRARVGLALPKRMAGAKRRGKIDLNPLWAGSSSPTPARW
jgi:transporter family-2 protein